MSRRSGVPLEERKKKLMLGHLHWERKRHPFIADFGHHGFWLLEVLSRGSQGGSVRLAIDGDIADMYT